MEGMGLANPGCVDRLGHLSSRLLGLGTVNYYCALCRASRVTQNLSFISLPDLLEEDSYSEWYRREVEPHHSHVWILNGARSNGQVADCFAGSYPPLSLKRETIQAICGSLPQHKQRATFVHNVCRRSASIVDQRPMIKSLQVLNQAYKANPKRSDWPRLLKQVGLWPG